MGDASTQDKTLANLLKEDRRFEPPADLAANANLTAEAYDAAAADREGFWATQAERLAWDTRWDQVLDRSNAPTSRSRWPGNRRNEKYAARRAATLLFGYMAGRLPSGEPSIVEDETPSTDANSSAKRVSGTRL